jgi:hypothetical protein
MKDQKKTVQQNALTSLSPAELQQVVGGQKARSRRGRGSGRSAG